MNEESSSLQSPLPEEQAAIDSAAPFMMEQTPTPTVPLEAGIPPQTIAQSAQVSQSPGRLKRIWRHGKQRWSYLTTGSGQPDVYDPAIDEAPSPEQDRAQLERSLANYAWSQDALDECIRAGTVEGVVRTPANARLLLAPAARLILAGDTGRAQRMLSGYDYVSHYVDYNHAQWEATRLALANRDIPSGLAIAQQIVEPLDRGAALSQH